MSEPIWTNPTLPDWVPRPRLMERFLEGCEKKVVYVQGGTGQGKTVAATQWVQAYCPKARWFSCADGSIEDLLRVPHTAGDQWTVLDDCDCLSKEQMERVGGALEREQGHFLVLSRGEVPPSFHALMGCGQLFLVEPHELDFTVEEAAEYLEKQRAFVSPQLIEEVLKGICSPQGIVVFVQISRSHPSYSSQQIVEQIKEALFLGFRSTLLPRFTSREWEVLLMLSCVQEFSGQLAGLFDGDHTVWDVLDRIRYKSDMLVHFPAEKRYQLTPLAREYLRWFRFKQLPGEENLRLCRKAGQCFEALQQWEKAMECYFEVEDYQSAIPLLETIASQDVASNQIWKLERFYDAVPLELVQESPALCCGMAMLRLVRFRLEESQQWYQLLLKMQKRLDKDDPRQEEVRNKLCYMRMAMPQLGFSGFLPFVMQTTDDIRKGRLRMQRPSITGQRPSVLDGGLDFSRWIRHIGLLRPILEQAAVTIFGEAGVGIVPVAVAEYIYQKNNMREAILQAVTGVTQCERSGVGATVFAGYSVQAWIMQMSGRPDTAKSILRNVYKRMEDTEGEELLANCRALQVRLGLYSGEVEEAVQWMRTKAPAIGQKICTFDRYRDFLLLRILFAQGQTVQFLALAQRVRPICESFGREMELIQLDLLMGIFHNREGDKNKAYSYLKQSLRRARRYGYIRLIADEGDHAYRLLRGYRDAGMVEEKEKKFFSAVLEAAKHTALLYPEYLKTQSMQGNLTAAEAQVLRLLSHGYTNQQVADFLNVSLSTVKFHTTHIYQKLGVANRQQAIRRAQQMGLL